ncbi:hypothetical protein [Hahella sp. HN01]|uniref:hypothetical protein n=1 Tax=Hahella sp. HN01 TaxID=2847262 RepID=UPI001C1EBBE3|nr:hypothetical protein [Hahella sp. HN01]MBU6955270.1 hypothetical protein [Hahella sp. HN01]
MDFSSLFSIDTYKPVHVFRHHKIAKRYQFDITNETSKIFQTQYTHNGVLNYVIKIKAVKLYDRMLAKNFRCSMTIIVYHPLTAEEVSILNRQRNKIANGVGGVVGFASQRLLPFSKGKGGQPTRGVKEVGKTEAKEAVAKGATGAGAAVVARNFVLDNIREYNEGDILIQLEAEVKGGIGPQHSGTSVVVRRQAYDPLGELF